MHAPLTVDTCTKPEPRRQSDCTPLQEARAPRRPRHRDLVSAVTPRRTHAHNTFVLEGNGEDDATVLEHGSLRNFAI